MRISAPQDPRLESGDYAGGHPFTPCYVGIGPASLRMEATVETLIWLGIAALLISWARSKVAPAKTEPEAERLRALLVTTRKDLQALEAANREIHFKLRKQREKHQGIRSMPLEGSPEYEIAAQQGRIGRLLEATELDSEGR